MINGGIVLPGMQYHSAEVNGFAVEQVAGFSFAPSNHALTEFLLNEGGRGLSTARMRQRLSPDQESNVDNSDDIRWLFRP